MSLVICAVAEVESSKRELDRSLAELRRKISKPFSGVWPSFVCDVLVMIVCVWCAAVCMQAVGRSCRDCVMTTITN